MKEHYAVLLDVVSIQKYIFSSNRLKVNLGASYLVDNIFKEELFEALKKTLGYDPDLFSWGKEPERIAVKDLDTDFEIGYIGGGNALLLFRQEGQARTFIQLWSRNLLLSSPGLQPASALLPVNSSFFTDSVVFVEAMDALFKKMAENKNYYFYNTALHKFGIVADCPFSLQSAETFIVDADEKSKYKYVSAGTKAKMEGAKKSTEQMQMIFRDILGEKYCIPDELDKLGQSDGESHIAVVHVDGNYMSRRFKNCPDLLARRKLSFSVKEASTKCMKGLFKYLVQILENGDLNKKNGFTIKRDEKKRLLLPIRPIVLGGDDITFVTDGRLGVPLAEKLLNLMAGEKLDDGVPFYACGGVAIVKTKYPFCRAYEYAEELCTSAKEKAWREGESSWLDWHISYGSFAGNLEVIRKTALTAQKNPLIFGPYLVSGGEADHEKNIRFLKNGMEKLFSWPRSKRKDLRQAISLGREETRKALKDFSKRSMKLPDVYPGRNYHDTGWDNDRTPYYDMVELMEFYPRFILQKEA